VKQLKAFAAVVPGLAVQSISRWFNLFVNTPLAHPKWAVDAQNLSLGIGALVAVILCIVDAPKGKEGLRSRAKTLFILTIIGMTQAV